MGCGASRGGVGSEYKAGSAAISAPQHTSGGFLGLGEVQWHEIDHADREDVRHDEGERMLALAGAVVRIQRRRNQGAWGAPVDADEWRVVLTTGPSAATSSQEAILLASEIPTEERAREVRYILMRHGVCKVLKAAGTRVRGMTALDVRNAVVVAIGRGHLNPADILKATHGADLFPTALLQAVTPWCVSDAGLDVLLIHGLAGDAEHTWAVDDRHWVRDFLLHPNGAIFGRPEVLGLPWLAPERVRVMAARHELNFALPNRAAIDTTCRSLLEAMATAQVGTAPLLIIAHCMGGMVAKRLLDVAESERPHLRIHDRCVGMVFLDTPHNGAALVNQPGRLGDGPVPVEKFLDPVGNRTELVALNSRFLRRLHVRFANFRALRPLAAAPPGSSWRRMRLPFATHPVVQAGESDLYACVDAGLRRDGLDSHGVLDSSMDLDRDAWTITRFVNAADPTLAPIGRACAAIMAAAVPRDAAAAVAVEEGMDGLHRAVLRRTLTVLPARMAVYEALQELHEYDAGTATLARRALDALAGSHAATAVIERASQSMSPVTVAALALGVGIVGFMALSGTSIASVAALGTTLGPAGTLAAGTGAVVAVTAAGVLLERTLRPHRDQVRTVAEIMRDQHYEERLQALRAIPDEEFRTCLDSLLSDLINEVSIDALLRNREPSPAAAGGAAPLTNCHATRVALLGHEPDLFADISAVTQEILPSMGPDITAAECKAIARAALLRAQAPGGATRAALATRWHAFLRQLLRR